MKSASIQSTCYHCGENLIHHQIQLEEKFFCCQGCKTVYGILNDHELCAYYELNQAPGIQKLYPKNEHKYQYLELPEIAQKIIQYQDDKQCQVNLYIPQIHCSSCLYLLENISNIDPGIISCSVNFEKKEIFFFFDPKLTNLRGVIESLDALGYEPHLSLAEAKTPIQGFDKIRLYKIGLAGFAFSNIMVFSFADYFAILNQIDPLIKHSLQWASLLLSIPVFFYSASEFFVSSWKALRNKYINIDLPIAFSLLITFSRSIYEIISQTGSGYLDSMTGIVFFMLIGRWLQSRTITSQSFERDYQSFFPIAVTKLANEKYIPTEVSNLKENDVLLIHTQEIIPVDGILSKGKAEIDYSFVNGESLIHPVEIGKLIYAGARQVGSPIEIVVVKPLSQSYLTSLWNKSKQKTGAKIDNTFYDRAGAYFGMAVLMIGLASFVYWWQLQEYQKMWNAITTVFIIACPCILLLAKTYTYGFFLQALNKLKIYLRDADVLSTFEKIQNVVFDKTGTLTETRSHHIRYYGKKLGKEELEMVASLAMSSSHPLSRAILDFIPHDNPKIPEHFKDHKGRGVEAWINDRHIKLGSEEFVGGKITQEHSTKVVLKIDHEILGEYIIHNQYRFGIGSMLKKIQSKYSISILSGDNDRESTRLSKILGAESRLLFQQNPAQKQNYIQELQNSEGPVMMIGDGLNDANALKQADLGIAIMNNNNTFTPAADIIMEAKMLKKMDKIMAFASSSKPVVQVIFAFSILYNASGLYFAVQGKLSPLIAAILMPLSSLSILLFSYVVTNYLTKKYNLNVIQSLSIHSKEEIK